MRLLSRLVIAFVACFVAIALPNAPAQAADEIYITLSPDHGVPGEVVSFSGNVTANEDVEIYYYLDDDTSIKVAEDETNSAGKFSGTFTVPESCTGDHDVCAYIDTSPQAIDKFTVEPGLTIIPEEGTVGTMVTVEGHGFAEEEEDIKLRYYLNDHDYETVAENITAYDDGWWEYSFEIPPSAKDDHKIDAEGEESQDNEVEDATFEVIPGITINKTSGSVGDNITMMGNGFEADDRYIEILFAGEEAETEPEIIRADDNGYWEASFKVPEMPIDTYSVTAEGYWTRKEDIESWSFEIKPGLVLTPDEGHVGTNLTVTGSGFATNKNVVIKYDGIQKATARTDGKGSFSGASFLVPKGSHGPSYEVTAKDAEENEATAIFTMESNKPPTPALISPPDRGRVGFIGKVRPTFEWSEVEDPSGVYYSLQIATSANVTDTGFVDYVFSIEGLVETSYTLNETAALTYDTYYWIVQAVDGAGNAGNWTSARSFRAGLLPLWGFIVIIVAAVVLIGALVYFFIIRKRRYYY